VLDLGETALDADTFDDYLMEMKNHYTAEKVWSHQQPTKSTNLNDNFSITSWVHEKQESGISTPLNLQFRLQL